MQLDDDSQQSKQGNGKEWSILEKVALASVQEQRRSRRWGIFFKSLTFLYLSVFVVALISSNSSNLQSLNEPHVALVNVSGVISADTPANANDIAGGLRAAFKAENTVAVIVAINSPGGSPVQAGYVNDEIVRLRAKYPEKKVYAVISDLGASGGYYIAAAADEIYADKASLVGSIGVISAGFGATGLMEKIGLERRVYSSGESKSFLDMFSPEKEADKEFWQEVLGVTHQQFIQVVKDGRGDRLLDDPKIFSGLIWTGQQAVELGLVDGLGSAGSVAREVIGVEKISDYTRKPQPWEDFARQFGMSVSAGLSTVLTPVLR